MEVKDVAVGVGAEEDIAAADPPQSGAVPTRHGPIPAITNRGSLAFLRRKIPMPHATRIFDSACHQTFIEWTKDCNPIHTDAVAARRTAAGAPVVHGMHSLLWALDCAAPDLSAPTATTIIQAQFLKPIYVGDSVELHMRTAASGAVDLELRADSVPVSLIRILPRGRMPDAAPAQPPEAWLATPRERAMDTLAELSGAIPLGEWAAVGFPQAAIWLGTNAVNAIAATSYLVGMECPGLHSIYSKLTFGLDADVPTNALSYSVSLVDPRFRLVRMLATGGGIRATIEAFSRPPPTMQPKTADLGQRVPSDAFVGQRVLVIGGSRGLGEVTAKLIAAGGGYPVITYASGAEDAAAVAADISAFGGTCEVRHYDATAPAAAQLQGLGGPFTSMYYFATGRIWRRRRSGFDADMLRGFLACYVEGFHDLCVALLARQDTGLAAFYPSSTAVAERPRDTTEYAMAKAAGEILCADLAGQISGLRIHLVRLPRVATDQTSGMTDVPAETAHAVMLPIIRDMQRALAPRA